MSYKNNNDIFLSYQWNSKIEAKCIFDFLSNDYKVWMDDHELVSGGTLSDEIADAIKDSELFVCCITQKYAQSEICKNEINFAIELKKPIIPLMLDDVSIGELRGVGFLISKLLRVNIYKDPSFFTTLNDKLASEIVDAINSKLKPKSNDVEDQIAWKKSGDLGFFFKSDDDVWFEKTGDFIFASFNLINQDEYETILFDKNRAIYIKLTNREVFWGNSMNEIDNFIEKGRWLSADDFEEVDEKAAWKRSDSPNAYFFLAKKNNWTEIYDGKIIYSFEESKSDTRNENEVILYDISRDMYVKLTQKCALWGSESKNICNSFSIGFWMKNYKIKYL